MHAFQGWLVRAFASVTPVAAFMRTHWGWPAAESVHFIGLSLLVGALVPWDLRLLGVGRRIPIAAANQLIPWALAGFALTALSGVMFLMNCASVAEANKVDPSATPGNTNSHQ